MSQTKPSHDFLFILLIGLVLTIGFTLWFRLAVLPPPLAGLEVGRELPPIRAAGWLNGQPPTEGDLRGKVIVLDAWATWCGVCRKLAAEHVEAYDKYHGRGVVFLGLTDEGADRLPAIEQFVSSTDVPWPNGYGAVETLRELGVAEVRPGAWVIDRDGKIVWKYGSSEPIEDAIERALAAGH